MQDQVIYINVNYLHVQFSDMDLIHREISLKVAFECTGKVICVNEKAVLAFGIQKSPLPQ